MARKGLGKGLDSLIPDYYNEDFDSNSTQSLEDLLNEKEDNNNVEDSVVEKQEENIFEKLEDENDRESNTDTSSSSEEIQVDKSESEDLHSVQSSGEGLQTLQENKIQEEHVAEVREIVDKNPRITLWS